MNTKHKGRAKAFTLIEVLASMAVLMIIVLILGRVFQDSTNIWNLGTRRSQQNMTGRAVMDFIARDVAEAVCGTNLSFRLESYDFRVFGSAPNTGYDWEWWNDSIYFVSLSADPDSAHPRTARLTHYYVGYTKDVNGADLNGRYSLMRSAYHGGTNVSVSTMRVAYGLPGWWSNAIVRANMDDAAEVIAENIGSFEVWCVGYTNDAAGLCSYKNMIGYNSERRNSPFEASKLPAYIEIYLSMMDEAAAVRAAELYKAGQNLQARQYVESVERRYAVRVHFANRDGYTGRR
jgi:type II secretory pathway pseudopilin PulG